MDCSVVSLFQLRISRRATPRSSRTGSVMSRGMKLLGSSLFCLFLSPTAFAATVTLAWDASPGAEVTGYRLYYGYASQTYDGRLDVGNSTTTPVSALESGKTYYFAVTAYDGYGTESPFSNEISYFVPRADSPPPSVQITSPSTGSMVATRSTIQITASASGDTGVTAVRFYVNGNLICSDTVGPYTCAWRVPPRAGRTYQLEVKASDAQGNVGSSGVVTVISQ